MSEGNDIWALLAKALDGAGLPYAVIGGHAVNVWLEPRFTADVDIVVAADAAALGGVGLALEAAGYALAAAVGAELPSGPDFVRYTRGSADPPIEFQVAKTGLQRDLLARARVGATGMLIATAEDLILLKLIAYRSKDRADLAGLLTLPGLDWQYIEMHAAEWDVLDRLNRLRVI